MKNGIRQDRFTVGTNLTAEERRKLQEMAKKEERSLSAQITVMVRKQLAQLEERV